MKEWWTRLQRRKIRHHGPWLIPKGLGQPSVHEHLLSIMPKRPTDFEPYGERSDEERGGDCSCSCLWYLALEDAPCDWGVCSNPKSPRCGLLTFEHQGCPNYEYDKHDRYIFDG